MGQSVGVLGGGVAGLTVAHELAERGFEVTVYEQRPVLGGKARSIPVPRSGRDDHPNLPGEHGFRFFPGFYQHLPDTMCRIPLDGGSRTVFDNLVPTTEAEFAGTADTVVVPDRLPASRADWQTAISAIGPIARLGLTADDVIHFLDRMFVLATSCTERRFWQWENTRWWDFIGAEGRSQAFRSMFADGATRRFVAARATEISTRTCGYILLQLMHDASVPGRAMDRVLNGPTSEVWIDPWKRYLLGKGVRFQTKTLIRGIRCRNGHIEGVRVSHGQATKMVAHDQYVLALPALDAAQLVNDDVLDADQRLRGIGALATRWMNGIQFYLDRDIPIVHGHTVYTDAPWGLTSISQPQFWSGFNLGGMGDGRVRGILSVDISDWTAPGRLHHKPAMDLPSEQVAEEVWYELKQALNRDAVVLDDRYLVRPPFLDPDIVGTNPRREINLEPMLINTVGSWYLRPDAVTAIDNLFLAADYVRTSTDLATMEGANEAGRRAVNGILAATCSAGRPCRLWSPWEPRSLGPLRALDRAYLATGAGHPRDVGLGRLAAGPVERGIEILLRSLGIVLDRAGMRRLVQQASTGPRQVPAGRPDPVIDLREMEAEIDVREPERAP